MHTVDQDGFVVITVIGSFICLTGFGGLLNVTDTQEALVASLHRITSDSEHRHCKIMKKEEF